MAQIFAAHHPERVAGLSLMDAIPQDFDLWATQAFPNRYPQERQESLETVRRFAEKAADGDLRQEDISDWITVDTLERYGESYVKLLTNNPSYWRTFYWQNQYIIASGAQVRSKGMLGDLPLTVIVAMEDCPGDCPYQQCLAAL